MKNISAAVADAGPLIHLDEFAWLFVLESFETFPDLKPSLIEQVLNSLPEE